MRVTPTRRRRRGNGTVETWASEGDETPQRQQEGIEAENVDVPALMLPARALAAASPALDPSASTAASSPPLLVPPAPPVGETHSVETILAATEALQRVERLQAEVEQAATPYAGGDDIHVAHDYRSACSDLIKQFPWLALSKDIDQRLWSSWQRELAALEGLLAVAATAPTMSDRSRLKAEGEMKLRDALYVALRNYSALIQDVQATATPLLVHRLSLAQAHVMYALEIHSASQDKKSWHTPERYYERARRWCVLQGETHYHLARIVLHDNRCAEALYHLVRSRVASVPFESPGSLAGQFAHVASLRESAAAETGTGGTECWVQLDRVVLSAVAPYFGQPQEFMAHRRTPHALTSALCGVLDTVCGDNGPVPASSEESDAVVVAGATQIVRIVGLLIACACLKMDAVQSSVATLSEANEWGTIHNARAVELIISVVNGLLHRVLSAITSPLRSTPQKELALQFMLPSITVAFTWLVKTPWRQMVSDATRATCEQLSTMVLTGIIAGGFLAPHEDHADQTAAQRLVEEVEVLGFRCYEVITHAEAGAASTEVASTQVEESLTERELLQRRIVKFLSYVESFMTPRPAAAAVIASAAPSASSPVAEAAPTANDVTRQLHQLSVNPPTTSARDGAETEPSASSTRAPVTGVRELWTPPKTTSTTRSTSTSKAKSKSDAAHSKPSVAPASTPSPSSASGSDRVVVLDAANIAMRHGLQRRFSCRGIQLCAEHFIAQGDRVVAFLPDYCLDVDADGSFRRRVAPSGGGRGGGRRRLTITPDDRVLLEILVDSGVVVLTPAMDSDDLYCIHYARRHDAFLVTNDLFRDHISETDGPKARQTELRNWLQTRRISYTWVADEFLPNPNSAYEKLRLTAAAAAATSTAATAP